jgi:hypothetical protein
LPPLVSLMLSSDIGLLFAAMVSPDPSKSNRLPDVIHVMAQKKNPAARARGRVSPW